MSIWETSHPNWGKLASAYGAWNMSEFPSPINNDEVSKMHKRKEN